MNDSSAHQITLAIKVRFKRGNSKPRLRGEAKKGATIRDRIRGRKVRFRLQRHTRHNPYKGLYDACEGKRGQQLYLVGLCRCCWNISNCE